MAAVLLAAGSALLPDLLVAAGPAPRGWSDLPLPSGSYVRLYVPRSLDAASPAPLLLFLHGAGSRPDVWVHFLDSPAEASGMVVVAPRSKGLGWEVPEDEVVLRESLALARQLANIDPRRISIGGISAGGAAAARHAYGRVDGELGHFAGVFIMSSPFANIAAIEDPGYVAPLRQYYGMNDPNFIDGKRDLMRAQWLRLGVPFEEEIEPGYGHNDFPPNTLPDAFAFLARQLYPEFSATCQPTADSLCLEHGRYRASITWRSATASGVGRPVPIASGDSGLFWFFAPSNIELLLKVLDGCAVNGRVWVFLSATTDVEYTVTVTDTVSGAARTYGNALGHAAMPVTDTSAFATCN